jgi:rare lipoprotein A (peptidoglycan hydrolase)
MMKKALSFFAVLCALMGPVCAAFAQENTSTIPAGSAAAGNKTTAASSGFGKAWRQTGVATYGPDIDGIPTSSGELYKASGFTAAHRDLPMNTLVLVTNTDNGKQAVVRVNDRGPFSRDYLIEVSYAAAQRLGMIQDGTANVVLTQSMSDGSAPSLAFNKTPQDPAAEKARVAEYAQQASLAGAAGGVGAATDAASSSMPGASPAYTSAQNAARKAAAARSGAASSGKSSPLTRQAAGGPASTQGTSAGQNSPSARQAAGVPASTAGASAVKPSSSAGQAASVPANSNGAIPAFAQDVPFQDRPNVPPDAYNPLQGMYKNPTDASNGTPVTQTPPSAATEAGDTNAEAAAAATAPAAAADDDSPVLPAAAGAAAGATLAAAANAGSPDDVSSTPTAPAQIEPVAANARPPVSTDNPGLPPDAEITPSVNTAASAPVKPPVITYPSATVLGAKQITPGKMYTLQVGTFRVTRNAVDVFDRLRDAGFNPAYEKTSDGLFRIVIPHIKGENIVQSAKTLGQAGFAEVIARQE